ncbi:MAG: hypothetical protein R2827_16090 [Bdellovibrionales bacterium]
MSEVSNPSRDQELYLENVKKFQELVDELMKPSPNEAQVKKMMQNLDLEYKKEPIERLNMVLRALHQ